METIDGIRFASTDDIVAMKMDVITRKGRKKDFWDLHKFLETYDITTMIRLHEERYPWSHDKSSQIENLTDFALADDEPDPICLDGKIWNFIKEDFLDIVEELSNTNLIRLKLSVFFLLLSLALKYPKFVV